jgi:hypothetical protein
LLLAALLMECQGLQDVARQLIRTAAGTMQQLLLCWGSSCRSSSRLQERQAFLLLLLLLLLVVMVVVLLLMMMCPMLAVASKLMPFLLHSASSWLRCMP